MTTIATDGKSMAGDGNSYCNGTLAARSSVKVHRLKDGSLFGACGSSGWGDKLQEWCDSWAQGGIPAGDPPKGDDGDGFMILRPDGTLLQGGSDGLAVPIDAPFAIGSGMDYAIGAMDAGASPEEALIIASERDKSTGGKITVLHLQPQTNLRAA